MLVALSRSTGTTLLAVSGAGTEATLATGAVLDDLYLISRPISVTTEVAIIVPDRRKLPDTLLCSNLTPLRSFSTFGCR